MRHIAAVALIGLVVAAPAVAASRIASKRPPILHPRNVDYGDTPGSGAVVDLNVKEAHHHVHRCGHDGR